LRREWQDHGALLDIRFIAELRVQHLVHAEGAARQQLLPGRRTPNPFFDFRLIDARVPWKMGYAASA